MNARKSFRFILIFAVLMLAPFSLSTTGDLAENNACAETAGDECVWQPGSYCMVSGHAKQNYVSEAE